MPTAKTEFRFVIYTPKKDIFQKLKYPLFNCQFTRKYPYFPRSYLRWQHLKFFLFESLHFCMKCQSYPKSTKIDAFEQKKKLHVSQPYTIIIILSTPFQCRNLTSSSQTSGKTQKLNAIGNHKNNAMFRKMLKLFTQNTTWGFIFMCDLHRKVNLCTKCTINMYCSKQGNPFDYVDKCISCYDNSNEVLN